MAEKVYEVRLHVEAQNLGTLLSVITDSSSLISVVPTQESAMIKAQAVKTKHRFHNGIRDKGISGEELVLKILNEAATRADPVQSLTQISNVFVQKGFAGKSASPVLSKLVKEGKVRALGMGKFCASGVSLRI